MARRSAKQAGNIEEGKAGQAAAVWVPINELVPWSDNPRKNEHAVEKVAELIRRYGFGAPLVARKVNREIVAGHTRIMAARLAGMNAVPVRFLDLTERQARQLARADNKSNEWADWDYDLLAAQLADETDEQKAIEGWDDHEYEKLIQHLSADEEGGARSLVPDDASLDELPEKVPARTKAGEVIRIGRHELRCGDCVELMCGIDEASVDAVVTDPPYFIGFMGRNWDKPGRTLAERFGKRAAGLDWDAPGLGSAIYESHIAWAKEGLRVLKPGGHLLAFAATRTQHRLACALEDAGFELRDTIAWCYWSGFPKSLDVSKALDKRAGAEREKVGEKPYTTPSASPGLPKNGKRTARMTPHITSPATREARAWQGWGTALKPAHEPIIVARKPLDGTVAENVLTHGVGGLNIDGCRYAFGDRAWPGPSDALDGQSWSQPVQPSTPAGSRANQERRNVFVDAPNGRWPANLYACPKPARSEREAGLSTLQSANDGTLQGGGVDAVDPVSKRFTKRAANIHATVKPVRLMRWLCRLVTPPGGLVVEPFLGSGTTMLAVELEGFRCLGFEREPTYCDIARARVEAVLMRGD